MKTKDLDHGVAVLSHALFLFHPLLHLYLISYVMYNHPCHSDSDTASHEPYAPTCCNYRTPLHCIQLTFLTHPSPQYT
eukprot:12110465-Ditylum_brightwellii.AAC.1